MDCVKVVENLSQREKNSILHVLQRDEQLRQGQEQKISNLKREINQIRMCCVLRSGDDQSKICLRCRTEMGVIFNRGALCPSCKYKVCKNCQEMMFNGSWLCKLCYKQRQLKWLTGEWTASFDQNPLRKWASGSDIMRASLQLAPDVFEPHHEKINIVYLQPGTTSIDIDDSPGNQGNNRQGKKVSRNGVGGSDQGRSRVEVPKEGDQLKLSELFNVLRVKKPEEKVTPETQVRRVTSRKYSESDSDSSSNSDVDVKSTSTAPSVTESELDGRRVESPRNLESPPLKTVESPRTLGLNGTPERYKPVIKVDPPDNRVSTEAQRPRAAPRSPKPAARRKVKSEHLDDENVLPTARPRTKDRRSPRSERVVEGQVSMSRSVELQSSAGRQTEDNEQFDKTSIHSELSLHVAKTRESLDKKFEVEKSRSQASLHKKSPESETLVRPKSKEQVARKSADNLTIEPKQAFNTEQKLRNKSVNELDNKIGADFQNTRSYNKSDILIRSNDSRETKYLDESQSSLYQKDIDSYSDRSIQSKHSIEKEQSLTAKEEDGQTQRSGSPYSISMDSLPSSHPSPTLNRSSLSSNPDSDTDSVARANSRPEPIFEQSPVSEKSAKTVPKAEEGEDVVVEEISKVQFRRVSKTVAQMGNLAKLSLSPNKNNSEEVHIEQMETQSRGGSGLREEGGVHGINNIFEEENPVEHDVCVKQVKSENMSPPCAVTDLLIKKLESMDKERNRKDSYRSRNISAEEMTWINEGELENRDVHNIKIKSAKRLPRLMTSSVASEYERKPSEADSIEDMIDNMARAQLYVDTDIPARASEADSDVGFNLTPISPFPQEIYEKRSGKYNRFAYISDDNLDGDSADDMLDGEADAEMDKFHDLVKTQGASIGNAGLQHEKKKEIKSMDSLDLILQDQEDYVDGNQQVIELESEYRNALKFSEEEEATRKSKESSSIHKGDGVDHISSKVTDEKKHWETVEVSGDKHHDKSSIEKLSSLQKLVKEEIEPVASKQMRTSKPKLKTADSLDILLDQQGNLVEKDLQNVEFDAELIANLEQNLKETLSVQKNSPKLSQEYAYLGMQHDVTAEKSKEKHSASESVSNQDDFDTLVGDAKDYLDGVTEKKGQITKPKLRCIEYIQHEYSPESSDSDILSVIEEVEDERSESSDDDGKKDTKGKAETEVGQNSSKGQLRLETIDTNQVVEAEVEPIEKTVVIKGNKSETSTRKDKEPDKDKARVKGKIFQKVEDIEQKGKYSHKGSSTVGAAQKSDTKRQEKYKKVHDHWLAVEKHEADILDIDELDKGNEDNMPNNASVKTEEIEDISAVKVGTEDNMLKTESVKSVKTEEIEDISAVKVGTEDNMLKNESVKTEEVEDSSTVKADSILKVAETKPVEIPTSEIIQVSNELGVKMNMGSMIRGNSELEKDDSGGIDKSSSPYEADSVNKVNKTDTEKHDNEIKECNNSKNSGNVHDLSNEEKQVSNVILNSTMIDSRTYFSASINDSDALCHSLSDISGFSISDITESIPVGEQSVTSDASKRHSISASRDFCHSLPDIEKQFQYIVDEDSVLKTSINDSKAICQSISECEEPVVEFYSDEPNSLIFSVPSEETIDKSQQMKDDVFDSKTAVTVPAHTDHAGIRERITSDEIRIEIMAMQQSKKKFKTEVEFQVDRSGKITPPATMSNEPQFFKAPEKPPRIRKRTSSSSGPSSPEISAVNPKTYMDSPKSEKLSSSRDSPRAMSECSVSQDDSGNVSGGSRGTTPEHRRTDSSYSQSSIPSTLSNVTDEDEDIDRIVAKVQKQSNTSRGSNLLSVFGDSRESLASYYSDAGDIAYSNIPITGEVLFSLNYNYKTNMLEVGVKQCRNIALADTKRRRSDPYVKTYLLPDRTRGGKRKTKVKKHTTSPTFEETLKYSLTKSELENRTLWLTVWHNDRFGRNVFLGEVTINFDYYKFEDPFPKWYPLEERMDAPPPAMMVYKGDLSVCIRFVPAEKKTGASPASTSKQKKESGKGQLQVMVKEARNLTGVKSNGFSDPFCKAYLLPERHKSSKQKTAVVKKDCSPVWNHTFIFEDVLLMELRERCLELTIWDYEKLTSNDFLGGIRLNLGTGVSGGKPVDWMDARGEEMSMWQAMLDRPNIWIDGALILRPNMEKRKF